MALFLIIGLAINGCKLIQKQKAAASEPVILAEGEGDRYAEIAAGNIEFAVSVGKPSNFFIWAKPNSAYVQFAEFQVNVWYSGGVVFENPLIKTKDDSLYFVSIRADSIFRDGKFVYKMPSGAERIRVGTYLAAGQFTFVEPIAENWSFLSAGWQLDESPTSSTIDTLIGSRIEGVWMHEEPEPKMHFIYNWEGGGEIFTDTTSGYTTGWFEPAYEGAWTFKVAAVDSAGNESADAVLPFYFFKPSTEPPPPPPDTTAPRAPLITIIADTIFNIKSYGRGLKINVEQ